MICLALQVAQLAEKHHNIKPNFGLHPWYGLCKQVLQRSDQPLPDPVCVSEAVTNQLTLSFLRWQQVFAGQIR